MDAVLVSKSDLALVMGEDAVASLIEQGAVKDDGGHYDLGAAVGAYLQRLGEFIEGADVKEQINEQRRLLNNLEAAKFEVESMIIAGDAFLCVDTERVTAETFLQIRSKILAIAGRCPRLICGQKKLADIVAVLQEPIDEALECLRPYAQDDFVARDVIGRDSE
jgi:hypothetical protein